MADFGMQLAHVLTEQGVRRYLARDLPLELSQQLDLSDIKGSANRVAQSVDQVRPLNMARGGRVVARHSDTSESERTAFTTRVRHELYLLLCTKDTSYRELRSRITKRGSLAQSAIINLIAAAVAAQLGVTIGFAAGLVALFLLAFIQMGKNAWCKQEKGQSA
jgi:hypothetical protein